MIDFFIRLILKELNLNFDCKDRTARIGIQSHQAKIKVDRNVMYCYSDDCKISISEKSK